MTTFTLPRFDQTESSSLQSSVSDLTGFGAMQTSAGNLPLQQLAYQTRIVGLAVRTTITQTYYNPFNECIEATYLFPIEGEQAVTDCEMWVADRIIRAKLKERGQARADYRQAIARGHRAALLEENRPETFSMKVGNIAPGEAVQVRIQTVGHLPVAHGEWTLRLPLVVAPRYTSGIPLPGESVGDGTAVDTNQVPDASSVTPPTWLPGFASPIDLKLEVSIELGTLVSQLDWPQQIRSSLHAVSVESSDADQGGAPKSCLIRVFPGERVNRDFILRGNLDDSQVSTSLIIEPPQVTNVASIEVPNDGEQDELQSLGTFAVQIIPPRCDANVPRDIVFLLDRSGSMGGWKIDAARRGISRLVDTLSPKDRFQVLAFDDSIESPFDSKRKPNSAWAQATDANRYNAVRWLAKIDSRGGTEMGQAIEQGLKAFLSEARDAQQSIQLPLRSRAIVLVTDGQITGEDSVLRLLGKVPESQRPRLFCLGVDRAVNGSVLQRLTKFSGGTFELVESEQRLDEVMQRFAGEMGSPAITDLEILPVDSSSAALSLAPSCQRVLYSGRATSIYGRAAHDRPLKLTVRGRLASGASWQATLSAEVPSNAFGEEPVLLPMWGRVRVRELEDSFVAKPSSDLLLQNKIVRCSLACSVLSRFTAFVAVDESERVNFSTDRLHEIVQPVEQPEGWQHGSLATLQIGSLISLPGRNVPPPKPISSISPSKIALPESFADLIVQQGIVSLDQFSEAESFAKLHGQSTSDALVTLQYATEDEVARITAESCQLPYVDLRQVQVNMQVIELIPESVARENNILPYSDAGGELTILISDPTDLETIEKLRFILNRSIHAMVASRDAIQDAINQYYGQVEGESVDSMLQEFTDTAIFYETADDLCFDPSASEYDATTTHFSYMPYGGSDEALDDDEICYAVPPLPPSPPVRSLKRSRRQDSQPDEAPVVRLVQLLLGEAVKLRASHVILRPQLDAIQVVYVIDGVEVERDRIPQRLLSAVIARLKILAKVDISTRDRLQSGSFAISAGDKSPICGVHFAPTSDGTTILLDFTLESIDSGEQIGPPDDAPEPVKAWWQSAAG